MTVNAFHSEVLAHRGLEIYELVFDLSDGDLHHLSPPKATMGWFVGGSSRLFTQYL